MKLLYYSTPSFADCDFPLIRELQHKGIDVYYLISLAPYSLHSTLFDIKEQLPSNKILPASSYKELRKYADYLDLSKVYIVNHLSGKDSAFSNLKLAFEVYRFVRRHRFDIIHTDTIYSMYDCILYAFRKKTILTVHDPFPHTGESSLRKRLFRRLAMNSVSRFVLLNERQKDAFAEVYKINPKRISTNRLGVYDCLPSIQTTKPLPLKKQILFFGRISPYKGIEFLLEAMRKVHSQIPEATLVIAGGGKLYFDKALYEGYDYIKIINRYVSLQELSDLLEESQLVVCPYTDATQSGVIMTAFAKCVPVVASNVGGLGEMIKDGANGSLVPPKDSMALSKAIIESLENEAILQKYRSNIKMEYFNGERSWEAIAEKYLELYKTHLSETKNRL